MKTILNQRQRRLLWLLLLPLQALASDPPTGGAGAGGSAYPNQNNDLSDWIMVGTILLVAVVAFYGLTRVIRGRGMRG